MQRLSKTKLKSVLIYFFICGAVLAGFLSYMYFVGIPKTRARNFYNLAIQAESEEEIQTAINYLETAEHYWAEEYIIEKLQDLQ